jgi:hypothetical protein
MMVGRRKIWKLVNLPIALEVPHMFHSPFCRAEIPLTHEFGTLCHPHP